jgi:hypothetical protein
MAKLSTAPLSDTAITAEARRVRMAVISFPLFCSHFDCNADGEMVRCNKLCKCE